MTYLVFANEESAGWRVEPSRLAELVLIDWPDVEIQEAAPVENESGGRGLYWTCEVEGTEVESWLDREGECLYIDGELGGVAAFAAWFRKNMPREIEFGFCDDSYSFHAVIEYGAASSDIMESIPD
ncbi:hypothetical protein [Streptomyces dioscori]|uniref:hypothetical protein n=1 Tax=Streptomyces dioscori TaxID=2109333 RepID=UPI00131AFCD0|nr:hypothetical protein [Streptomyces dioscori]